MDKLLDSRDQVVEEIMRIHKSLPSRPEIDNIEAATSLIQIVEKDDFARLEAIDKQIKSSEVPQELFNVLQEMRKGIVFYQSKEQKREASKILDLESAHLVFDELIQRASRCIASPSSSANESTNMTRPEPEATPTPVVSSVSPASLYFSDQTSVMSKEMFTRDDTFVTKAKSSLYSDGLLAPRKPQISDSTLKVTGEFDFTDPFEMCFS